MIRMRLSTEGIDSTRSISSDNYSHRNAISVVSVVITVVILTGRAQQQRSVVIFVVTVVEK